MTGKNLPPTTGREISSLKRRVTDLERVLDRIRRTTVRTPPLTLPPFAAMNGYGYDDDGLHTTSGTWRYYQPTNIVSSVVVDDTHHITIESSDSWAFRIDISGTYEIGMAVTFGGVPAGGNRAIGIQHIEAGELVADYPIATVAAATGTSTHLSGSRVVYAASGTFWWPMYADDSGVVHGEECTSFWAQLKVAGEPDPGYVGGA